MTTNSVARKLPSADWLAFGVGVAALFLQYIYPPLLLVTAAAVFMPSVLREVGLLHDADEWTLAVMRRAGFHALLVAALFIGFGYLAPSFRAAVPPNGITPQEIFGGETLRKAVIGTFLISYLIQYWGARTGVFRIMLGVAVLNLAPILGMLRTDRNFAAGYALGVLGIATVFVGLAFLVRRRPRIGGGVLLALCVLIFVFAIGNMDDPLIAWAQVSLILQAFLVFGVAGVALLREPAA